MKAPMITRKKIIDGESFQVWYLTTLLIVELCSELECSTDGMILTARNRSTRRKPCLSVTSPKISPTTTGLELNPGLRVGTPTTKCMGHGSDNVSVKMKSHKIYGFCGDEN
jgi:hypothetical protein